MVHVGQVGPFGLDAVDPGERAVEMRVAWVGLFPERVDDPDFDAIEDGEGVFVQGTCVGGVGKIAKAEAPTLAFAVTLREGVDFFAFDFKRTVDLVGCEFRSPIAEIEAAAFESIGEAGADAFEDGFVGVGWNGFHHQIVDGAQIVEPVQVIGVGVGVEQRVDFTDTGIKALHADVRRAVDENAETLPFDIDAAAAAVIFGIGRAADAAVATDLWHAARCSTAEDGHLHRLGRSALVNREKKLLVVCRATVSMSVDQISASWLATWAT